jgi:hypothetical protein
MKFVKKLNIKNVLRRIFPFQERGIPQSTRNEVK